MGAGARVTVSIAHTQTDALGVPVSGSVHVAPTAAPSAPLPIEAPADLLQNDVLQIQSASPGNNGYTQVIVFTIASQTQGYFSGFWKYGPTHADPTAHWYDLGTLEANNASLDPHKTGTGYTISPDGKTMTVTLIDGKDGDDVLHADAQIIDDAVPVISGRAASVAVPLFGPLGYLVLAGLLGLLGYRRLGA